MVMVDLDDIRAAAKRISGLHVRTPLLPWPLAGSNVWLKPENLQPTGAFKLRGASNAIGALTDAQRAAGVVTYSSGNHGRAVAWAARKYGVPAVVVMPDTTPAVKIEGVRAIGAEVVLVPAAERESRAEEILAERGGALVPPFDHPQVIAGQGTIGLEIAEDLPDVDIVLVPVSGGGLISGIAVAVKSLRPQARVIAVEPELAGDLAEGFAAGHRVGWPHEKTLRTVADALRVPLVAELTWAHIERFVDEVVTVSEDVILETTARLATSARIVAEPSGAVAPAVALTRPDLCSGRTVAIVSGGNVEPSLLVRVLSEYAT
ncbi:MAG TPA: threonine/serine dehydratase [Jiangellales bacterium]|nr:threonine/serine dehydratase [Jiangellales bacterium]